MTASQISSVAQSEVRMVGMVYPGCIVGYIQGGVHLSSTRVVYTGCTPLLYPGGIYQGVHMPPVLPQGVHMPPVIYLRVYLRGWIPPQGVYLRLWENPACLLPSLGESRLFIPLGL